MSLRKALGTRLRDVLSGACLGLLIILSSCSGETVQPQTATAVPITATRTIAPTVAKPTSVPTATPEATLPSPTPTASIGMVPLEEIQLGTIGPENTGEIELLQTWTFEEELGGLDWSPDSSQLAVGLLRRVQFLDIYAGKTGTKLEAPEDSRVPLPFSGPVTFNQDGSRITAGGSFGGAIIEWETATGEPTTDHIAVGANINAINYSPDGRKLAVGSSAGAFTLHLDLSGPRVFYANERGLDIVFHPTRALIGVADGGGQIAIWPVNGEQPLMEFDRFSFDIAFSPDGALLASTNEVWDVSTGDLVAELPQTETAQGHWSMNYHPSGDLLIVGTGSGPILVFEAEEYQLVEVLEHHSARVRDLDFSPDGKLLAASSDDGTVTIWGIKK